MHILNNTFQHVVAWARRMGWVKVLGGALAIIVAVFVVSLIFGNKTTVPLAESTSRTVEIKSVAELSAGQTPLSIVGTVQSQSEATVRAEKSGQAVSVNHALGDSVGAGTVVAEIENASERASVLMAQAGVEVAQANLNKTQNGGTNNQKDISAIQNTTAQTAVANAVNVAKQAVASAYSAADDAIHTKTDPLFINPGSITPQFALQTSNSQLSNDIQNRRVLVEQKMTNLNTLANALSASSDIDSALAEALATTKYISIFLSDVLVDLTYAVPSSSFPQSAISGYQSTINLGRTALLGAVASLNGAKTGYDGAVSGSAIATKQLSDSNTGGRSEDVSIATANVRQAQASLAGARANLEKTFIRAPISGTINSFSLKRGDYVQMASPVLTIANNGALEIVAYLTQSDAQSIVVGNKVSIEHTVSGVITRLAPALDPVTKKIEVRIGVSRAPTLINGQSVIVSIPRTDSSSSHASTSTQFTIPISAINIGSEETDVFTLDDTHTLVAHIVHIGKLLGDNVVVIDGVTADMNIVTDARGLRAGQVVSVK